MSNVAKSLTAAIIVAFSVAIAMAERSAKSPAEKPAENKLADKSKPKGPTIPHIPPTSRPRADLTPEQEAQLLADLKQSSPDLYYAHLIALKKTNPKLYRRALGYAWRKYVQWRDAPKKVRDQVVAEREATIEIGKLVYSIGQEKDPGRKAKLTAKLKQAVTRKFDAEIVIRDYRLAQLEKRLKDYRAELKERTAKRAGLIEQRYKEWLDRAGKKTPPAK